MNKILLVEDDASLGPALQKTLDIEGYQVTLCANLAEAREQNFSNYSLILLDWMLPDGQGIDLIKDINRAAPIIMLTARTDLIDKVLGLETGANDYITKPFEPRELLARIRVQLRQPQNPLTANTEEFKSNNLTFSLSERKLFYNDTEVILTKMEFDLLYLLATNPKQVFSREKLLDEVWGYDNFPTTRTVDTHVLQIRQKISTDVLETVRGIGYRYNPKHN
ncbi:MAG: DNA-binding response OmpR family regulator [Bacteriovoracaceae bacterium]|jgi:DNA-binding response OmpR family regulator